VEFPLLWKVASARERDFIAQQFWWSYLRTLEGILLTMQCKWTFTKRFILSTLQRKCPMLQ